MREIIPNSYLILAGVGLQWFSLFDIMDGMRARRLRAGSPLGRIIDEGLDQIAYSCIGSVIAYMLRLEPYQVLLCVGMVNVPFYAMEMKHILCKDLKIIIGEIGPVEVEVIFSAIFLFSGGIMGIEQYDAPLGSAIGLSHIAFLNNFQVKHIIAALLFVLYVVFIHDNLSDCFKVNAKKTITLFLPVIICGVLANNFLWLPSMQHETAIAYALIQNVFNIVVLKLMLFNMTKKPFTVF